MLSQLSRERMRTKPRSRRDALVIPLLAVTAVSAVAGGVALLARPHGSTFAPIALLHGSAFTTFFVPGLLLSLVVGGSSTVAAVLHARGSSYAIDATLFAAGTLTLFIADEMAIMNTLHPMHVVFGSIGLLLLLDGMRAAWRSTVHRHRWVLLVTAAEATGFLVAASVGIAVTVAGLGATPSTLLIVVAGAAEGVLCGMGQGLALPIPVPRLRFALATGVAAGLCWALAMAISSVFQLAVGIPVKVLTSVVGCTLALTTMGGIQWIVLRDHARGRAPWMGFTALAWTLALPLSLAPSPLVDETTPVATMAMLWASAGVAMAYVMANVTWLGARRLTSRGADVAAFGPRPGL